jgi:hypothetical protein
MYSTSANPRSASSSSDDVAGHLSHTAETAPVSAWAPMPGDESCPRCGRHLTWTGESPAHRYAPGDLDRCDYDLASGGA